MADPKRRDRPKGSELRASLKTKKPVRTPALEELPPRAPRAPGALAGSAAGAVAADVAGSIDPYLSRNEFKEGFYSQPSQPLTDAETMYGKGTKRGFEYPTVDPDTKMMQDAQGMADGGSVRGQKAIQVKKKQFRGIF
jgi:hypothetical protein